LASHSTTALGSELLDSLKNSVTDCAGVRTNTEAVIARVDASPPTGTTVVQLCVATAPKPLHESANATQLFRPDDAAQKRPSWSQLSEVSFRPTEADQQRLDAILGTSASAVGVHLANSWQERALGTLKDVPFFFGQTLLLCILPSLVGFAAISVFVWHASLMCSEFSGVTATYHHLEYLAEVRSTTSLVAETFKTALARAVFPITLMVLLCSQVSYIVVVPASRRTLLPLSVIYVAVGSAWVVAKSVGVFADWILRPSYACLLGGALALVVRIGRRIADHSFWWKMMTWLLINVVLTIISEVVLWPAVPDWTDLHKAAFVMIIAPFAAEIALTVGRFVSRSLPEHHEAAGWVLNGCMRDWPPTRDIPGKARI
jgi:hypothetical protein